MELLRARTGHALLARQSLSIPIKTVPGAARMGGYPCLALENMTAGGMVAYSYHSQQGQERQQSSPCLRGQATRQRVAKQLEALVPQRVALVPETAVGHGCRASPN